MPSLFRSDLDERVGLHVSGEIHEGFFMEVTQAHTSKTNIAITIQSSVLSLSLSRLVKSVVVLGLDEELQINLDQHAISIPF